MTEQQSPARRVDVDAPIHRVQVQLPSRTSGFRVPETRGRTRPTSRASCKWLATAALGAGGGDRGHIGHISGPSCPVHPRGRAYQRRHKTHTNIYIYIYTHSYIYIYTHTYTHTHTHTHILMHIHLVCPCACMNGWVYASPCSTSHSLDATRALGGAGKLLGC